MSEEKQFNSGSKPHESDNSLNVESEDAKH